MSEYTVKVTHIGNGKYGCRIFRNDKIIIEGIADNKMEIGPVCRCLMRTIDKGFGGDDYTHSARMRSPHKLVKHHWGGRT